MQYATQCARFDWHATREYLCTRLVRGPGPLLSSFPPRFVSAGLPVYRGGTSRVIPTVRIERQAEKKMRDNDEVGAIALPEVSAVLSYEYFYINPCCTQCECTLSDQQTGGGGVS